MADGTPTPENNDEIKKKRKSRKRFLVAEVPIFIELCSYCDNNWASNIKFYDVQQKTVKKKTRACEFCVFAMTLGVEGKMMPVVGANSQVEIALANMMLNGLDTEVIELELDPGTPEPETPAADTGEGEVG